MKPLVIEQPDRGFKCAKCGVKAYQYPIGVTDAYGRIIGGGFEWRHIDDSQICLPKEQDAS